MTRLFHHQSQTDQLGQLVQSGQSDRLALEVQLNHRHHQNQQDLQQKQQNRQQKQLGSLEACISTASFAAYLYTLGRTTHPQKN